MAAYRTKKSLRYQQVMRDQPRKKKPESPELKAARKAVQQLESALKHAESQAQNYGAELSSGTLLAHLPLEGGLPSSNAERMERMMEDKNLYLYWAAARKTIRRRLQREKARLVRLIGPTPQLPVPKKAPRKSCPPEFDFLVPGTSRGTSQEMRMETVQAAKAKEPLWTSSPAKSQQTYAEMISAIADKMVNEG